jgi:EAL domain-containing protein (putative c-di-GMP-specific phosphodiesterase class I)
VFQQEDRRDSDIYLGLENPLREAIRLNQLELHFQPQVLLASGRATSAEALLRWNAPEIGTVSPATVVRIAEASGVIGALSNWVINSAFRQQATWVKNGAPINLSLNLSTINLTDHELPEVVQQALGTWNIDPTTVTFEITESATIGDAEKSITVLQRLKDLGVNIALDDFGTGYSSMSYLKNFPLDELKIDRTFVQQLQLSSADQRIVRSVIALAHDFRLTVVAEGVEDESTAKELRRMGCDLSQGYFHSPALPSDAFIEWMAKHT